MTRVLEASVRSATLGEIRDELKQRSPKDGYRPYDSKLVSEDIQRAFEIAAQGKKPDEVVSIDAVVDVYARQLKGSVDQVNIHGPGVLSKAEAEAIADPRLNERIVGLRSELSRGNKPFTDKELVRHAALFIASHSAPTDQSGNAIDVLFPAFDVGNGENWGQRRAGIDARLITDGKAAASLMRMFISDSGEDTARRLRTFDPAKERLIVVQDSDDEAHFFPAAIDKKSGKVRGFDCQFNEVNFTDVDAEGFDKIFGRGSSKKVKDEEYSIAYSERLQKMFGQGKEIPLAKMDPPELDIAKLTDAAAVALQKYFTGLVQLPRGDFSDDDKKTLEAIRRAVRSGEQITVAVKNDDPILKMPRKFRGKPTEDYAVGWAMLELYQTVPELRRYYNVNAEPKTPNPVPA